jgi:ABC-type branched-subunit amino acid transport system permease subunit
MWSGEEMVNQVILTLAGQGTHYNLADALQTAVFVVLFYSAIIGLAGYVVAADSGRRHWLELWFDVLFFIIIPVLLLFYMQNLIFGLGACAIIWPTYLFVRSRVRRRLHETPPATLEHVDVLNSEQQSILQGRAVAGSFWFATAFALISLLGDLGFWFSGYAFAPVLWIWIGVRTLILPVAGYFLGMLAAWVAMRFALTREKNVSANGANGRVTKSRQLESLSSARAQEEAKDLVPNDFPLNSKGAQRFYLTLLISFALFFPVLDPILFGVGSAGRITGYGNAGYYIILALGLNIVVGFAGLLDLGYVAFFAIGAYTWAMIGSPQFTSLTGIVFDPNLQRALFWPMLLVAALVAAFWGVLLGVPTLRLRGDYLAIVTLGFGEIIPIVFRQMDAYTRGVNGLPGVQSPLLCLPGVGCLDWAQFTPIPYYYLILALIALLIFVNVRLRDSRLGRAWVAIREDEIAAASSGINLARTKLFAFGAGAFFSGIAGMYYSGKLGIITPEAFNTSDSILYLSMVVIGGLGSIPGVIVGAFAVYSINEFFLSKLDEVAADPNNFLHVFPATFQGFSFTNIRNLIFGVILVSIMIFRPEGMIPSTRRRRELHRAESEEPEVGSLDVVPGAPGFESEVHVE